MLEQFAKEFRIRYPDSDTVIEEGPAQSTDSTGMPYLTIVIGGVKQEGETCSYFSTLSKDDLHLWDMWWDSFFKYAKDCNKIVVRRFPTATQGIDYILDTFMTNEPRLIPRNVSQINGRFSFHKQ